MPTKLNSAGKMQNYVPAGNGDASGEYGDNATGSNKHFQIFKKPTNATNNNIGVQIKGDVEPIKASTKYNGNGKNHLNEQLKNKFGGKETPNLKKLLSDISDADDEMSGVIGDLYKNNPQLELKLGKNLNSKYQETMTYNYFTRESKIIYSVSVGSGAFDNDKNYAKGSTFFHESGHALDSSYIDATGHRSIWSYNYKSKEFEKSLSEMVQEELESFKDSTKFNELKQSIEQEFKDEWAQKYESEYKELQEKRRKFNDIIMNDPQVVEYGKKINEIGMEIIILKNELSTKLKKGETSVEETKPFTDKITQKQQELLDISHKSGDLQRQLYATKYPEKEKDSKRFDELFDLKFRMKEENENKKQVTYGDFSDMLEATTGRSLTGMGHGNSYWDYNGKKRGKEAFAEIMSAKATNLDSLKVLKKFIPKSLKIFDEIMGEIRK